MNVLEIGEPSGDELHQVVFQIRQRNKHLLHDLLLEVISYNLNVIIIIIIIIINLNYLFL